MRENSGTFLNKYDTLESLIYNEGIGLTLWNTVWCVFPLKSVGFSTPQFFQDLASTSKQQVLKLLECTFN